MKIQGNTLIKVYNSDIIGGKFIVPKGLERIRNDAFYNCASLTHIELPEGLVGIGAYAFQYCTSLTHIELPATLREIGNYAFFGCTSLTHIKLPATLREIGWGVFHGCTSLTHITFPNGKTHKHKCVDGYSLLVENTRQLGETTIIRGIWLDSLKDGKVIGDNCLVAEREGFTAHGKTLREALEDLEFKIAQDKLKNSPLSLDDEIGVNHYRAITGACKMGVAKWMEDNNVTKETILVRDLLPMLERTHAYGLEKFKSLIK